MQDNNNKRNQLEQTNTLTKHLKHKIYDHVRNEREMINSEVNVLMNSCWYIDITAVRSKYKKFFKMKSLNSSDNLYKSAIVNRAMRKYSLDVTKLSQTKLIHYAPLNDSGNLFISRTVPRGWEYCLTARKTIDTIDILKRDNHCGNSE